MISGIYQIRNQVNDNRYIGSAMSIQRRWTAHLNALRRGGHNNLHLQNAFDKYGEAAFVFEVLEDTEPENLIVCEQHYFDTLNPEYNISPTAGSPLGYRHTKEALKKMSETHTGERHPLYGKHHSTETRARISKTMMSKAATGKRHPNYGKPLSAETRAKISAALTGRSHPSRSHPCSAETKQKISAGLKAYWQRVREPAGQGKIE